MLHVDKTFLITTKTWLRMNSCRKKIKVSTTLMLIRFPQNILVRGWYSYHLKLCEYNNFRAIFITHIKYYSVFPVSLCHSHFLKGPKKDTMCLGEFEVWPTFYISRCRAGCNTMLYCNTSFLWFVNRYQIRFYLCKTPAVQMQSILLQIKRGSFF